MAGLTLAQIEARKPHRDFELGTHISLKHRYIFMQVSKAGSSTVKHHLQQKEFAGSRFRVQDVNNKYLSPHLSPYQLDERMLLRLLCSPRVRRVCMVRNPYSRLLSCYLHRIVREPESASSRVYRRQFGTPSQWPPSFSEFVHNICGQDSHAMESHWRVQHDELLIGLIDYSFIAHFETMSESIVALWQHLFGSDTPAPVNPADINASPMQTSAGNRLQEYYDAATQAAVADRFAADFASFGYCPDQLG